MNESKKDVKKARHWLCVLYPSAMYDNWKSILQEYNLPFALSPLHDRDIIDETGEQKKAHYHVILCFDGPTTEKVVQDLIDSLYIEHGPSVIQCRSVRGSLRYFSHKDNPDKFQYDEKDIFFGNGFNSTEYMSNSEKLELFVHILELCDKEDIFEYSDLIDYLKDNHEYEYLDIAVNSKTLALVSYFNSKRNKPNFIDKIKNQVTDEILANHYIVKK